MQQRYGPGPHFGAETKQLVAFITAEYASIEQEKVADDDLCPLCHTYKRVINQGRRQRLCQICQDSAARGQTSKAAAMAMRVARIEQENQRLREAVKSCSDLIAALQDRDLDSCAVEWGVAVQAIQQALATDKRG